MTTPSAGDLAGDLIEAVRLTQEFNQNPPLEGWSWFEAMKRYLAERPNAALAAWLDAEVESYHKHRAPTESP